MTSTPVGSEPESGEDADAGAELPDRARVVIVGGGIGHSVKKTIALGYLPVERLGESSYAIAAFGEEHAAQRLTASPYDPDRARILC